jgi:ATP-binding cassette subfamily B protein
MSNIDSVFKGKTIIIAAHRLSTIKRANQILVLDQGKLVETGNHLELLENRGFYFNLVRNQLDQIEL